jgi:hypothetical protein
VTSARSAKKTTLGGAPLPPSPVVGKKTPVKAASSKKQPKRSANDDDDEDEDEDEDEVEDELDEEEEEDEDDDEEEDEEEDEDEDEDDTQQGKKKAKSSKASAAAAAAAAATTATAQRTYLVLLGEHKYKFATKAASFDELKKQLAHAYSVGYQFDLQYYDAEVAEYLDFSDVTPTTLDRPFF